MGKLYATSDVHGYYDEWITALNNSGISLKNGDKLVIIGDLLDRGMKSKECILHAIKLINEYPNQVHYLKGNHEQLFLDVIQRLTKREMEPSEYNEFQWTLNSWLMNGGVESMTSFYPHSSSYTIFADLFKLKAEYTSEIKFLTDLPHYKVIDNFVFVHAGFETNVRLEEQTTENMLWIRDEFFNDFHPVEGDILQGKRVVHGHTPVQFLSDSAEGIYYGKHHICIDGGAANEFYVTVYNVTDDLVTVEPIQKEIKKAR